VRCRWKGKGKGKGNVAPARFEVILLAFSGAFAKLRMATFSFVMFVRPSAWNNSGAQWMDFDEIRHLSFFPENLSRKFQSH
jgi:hypothetical protein